MGITRLLIILIVVWLIWWLFKPLFQRRDQPPAQRPGDAEDMVRCSLCQLNLPKGEAVEEDGRYFCSPAHRQQYHEQQK